MRSLQVKKESITKEVQFDDDENKEVDEDQDGVKVIPTVIKIQKSTQKLKDRYEKLTGKSWQGAADQWKIRKSSKLQDFYADSEKEQHRQYTQIS